MQYDNTFKLEALKLSDEIGVRKAAAQLGIPYYTLSDWRCIRKHEGESAFVGVTSENMKVNRPLSGAATSGNRQMKRTGESRSLKPNYVKLNVPMRS